MNSEIKKQIDEVLSLPDSEKQLINLVEQLKTEGWSQLRIYVAFEDYADLLREKNREAELDTVLEVLELIYGWCPPQLKLFPHNLSNEKIARHREESQRGIKYDE